MKTEKNIWALVLAAGEGSRLKSLTTNSRGIAIPKQFCSLNRGISLLEETIERARSVVQRQNVTAIVAEQHREWWWPMLSVLAEENRIVQPLNRGTGNGILLPLLQIIDRDPQATLVLLPSDHHVGDEESLQRSIYNAIDQVHFGSDKIMLLGIRPDKVDPDLGYIVPGRSDKSGAQTVRRFIEKPDQALAAELLRDGALWNSFIIVASGHSLLNLYASRFPDVVQAMINALAARHSERRGQLQQLYENLPNIDFSRHVLADAEKQLRVVPVPRCGWSDLGTPRRVSEALARVENLAKTTRPVNAPFFDLARACESLQLAG